MKPKQNHRYRKETGGCQGGREWKKDGFKFGVSDARFYL